MEIVLTDDNFEVELAKATVPLLVDFYADWCGPCKMIAPIIEEIAHEYEGKIVVGKMDVDSNPNTAAKFGIMSIPTQMIFKNAQSVKTIVGFQPKETLVQNINEALR